MEPQEELKQLASSLYAEHPERALYKYTSLEGILGIQQSKGLFATKVQHFNDAAELNDAFYFFRRRTDELLGSTASGGPDPNLLTQLHQWLQSPSHTASAALFVVCFTELRDSLSQWRGYTPMHRGACLHLTADHVLACAKAQGYDVAKCVYENGTKYEIATKTIDLFVAAAAAIGPDSTNSYHPAFRSLQHHLLRVAVTFKHQAFGDEQEWRAVLQHDGSATPQICYRAGETMLIPYVLFSLKWPDTGKFMVAGVWVGPSPNRELTKTALESLFVGQTRGRYPVMLSACPYRQT